MASTARYGRLLSRRLASCSLISSTQPVKRHQNAPFTYSPRPTCRYLATPAAPTPKPRAEGGISTEELLRSFTMQGLTLPRFEKAVAVDINTFKSASPAEYHAAAAKFAAEVQRRQTPLDIDVRKLDGITAPILHDTACIISTFHPGGLLAAMPTAMLEAASAAGHKPSTLTLVSALILGNLYGKSKRLRKLEDRFRRIVAAANDPDALTLEAQLLLAQGSPDRAVTVLRRALTLREEFEWKPLARLSLARADVKLGRFPQALEALKDLREEGLPGVDVQLGHALRSTDRAEAKRCFEAAAGFHDLSAINALAEMEAEDAAAAKDEPTKQEHLRWAAEWSRLADMRVEY